MALFFINNISENREKPKQITKGFPYLGRSCFVIWHNMIPENTNHSLSAYQQHLPVIYIEKKTY